MSESGKKPKVLIVDDTPENIQVLMGTLKDQYAIVAAINGEKALKLAAAEPQPDLILLDIMMPGMDGFEVCQRLKMDAATCAIPVIFLSALDDTLNKVKGFSLGAVDYISKPFHPEEVLVRVNTHLTIHRLSQEVQAQRDQLENELKVVSELQHKLLPEELPDIRGLKLAVHYQTSRYAGGDYYDVVQLAPDCCGLLVADSEGHSAPATVMMAMTCSLFRSCPDLHDQPDRVLNFINTHLCKVNKESFVTALYAVYDGKRRMLRISRAGHPLPILFKSSENRAREVFCKGVFMMGVEPYNHVPVTEIRLDSGDRLLLYTDGVPERFNPKKRLYGEERLRRQMERSTGLDDPQILLKSIVQDLEDFAGGRPPDDDQALLLVTLR
jgi:sigma-B regulation protein RsbU (phosphoserine phosphatase)